jgi:hypothetical protein
MTMTRRRRTLPTTRNGTGGEGGMPPRLAATMKNK